MAWFRVDDVLCDEPIPAWRDAYGRKRYRATHTYVVAWPDGVVKVGIAGDKTRWSKFVSKGAALVMLMTFAKCADAIDAERSIEAKLSELGTPAFASRFDAQAHLGSGGGGYSECYRLGPTNGDALLAFLRVYRRAVA